MRKILVFFVFCFAVFSRSGAQVQNKPTIPEKKTALNQVDHKGRRHGMWLTTTEPRLGEPGVNMFGNFNHGLRTGAWYAIDHLGDLISIETYRNDVLDGEVKYYDQGKLYCTGQYRGLNPANDFDTIVVVNPVTQEEDYRIIATERGSLRHGSWRYFDPATGRLAKEEEYQVDELIYRKDYELAQQADSLYRKNHEASMPHNKKGKFLSSPAKRSRSTGN